MEDKSRMDDFLGNEKFKIIKNYISYYDTQFVCLFDYLVSAFLDLL